MCSYFSVQCFAHLLSKHQSVTRAHSFTLRLNVGIRVQSFDHRCRCCCRCRRRPRKRKDSRMCSFDLCTHASARSHLQIIPVPYAYSEYGVFCFTHYCFNIRDVITLLLCSLFGVFISVTLHTYKCGSAHTHTTNGTCTLYSQKAIICMYAWCRLSRWVHIRWNSFHKKVPRHSIAIVIFILKILHLT